ncbi:GNAT family acetyltransferase [Alkalihalobacillus trypoxylicola]|uniref:GNAT family acetyltransferase n=2 Tax=Alkalihalobacillus trypoxylicola TaxID=519424 RepID=A0A161QJ05_9BACI|nr:GNAT family protein [Alkalihalobacillus trypoxylicola]KYG29538.1 GNAT family acetyltransferase [Alkalihalobacillus trypoxylicola]
MMTKIVTERLLLKEMDNSHSTSLFKIWSDPAVTKFMNIERFTSEEQAVQMIELLKQLSKEKKAIRYSIFLSKTNQIIGSCGFNSLDFEHLKAEIGYDLGKDFWGKGYAAEALESLLNYAFHSLNIQRIEAKIEPGNTPSIKLVERLNFQFEGTLRQAEKSKGTFIDLNMYSKLKTD